MVYRAELQRKNKKEFRNKSKLFNTFCKWCLGRGSNPHVHKGHRILSPVRLPIPPPKQLTLNKLARLVLEVQT